MRSFSTTWARGASRRSDEKMRRRVGHFGRGRGRRRHAAVSSAGGPRRATGCCCIVSAGLVGAWQGEYASGEAAARAAADSTQAALTAAIFGISTVSIA